MSRKKRGSFSQSESKRRYAARRRARDEGWPGIQVIASTEPVPIRPGGMVTIDMDIANGKFTIHSHEEEPREVIRSLFRKDVAGLGVERTPDEPESAGAIEKAERPYRWLCWLCPEGIVNERVGDELERLSKTAGDEVPGWWTRAIRVMWIYWLVLRDTVVEKTRDLIHGERSGRRS